MRRSVTINLLFLLVSCVFIACSQPAESPVQTTASSVPDLDHVKTYLPEKPGYKAFYANCMICHSDRYILNQPDLPEKSWTAIVTKMQKTFGAPVSDSSAHEIIQYLVSIKGTGS